MVILVIILSIVFGLTSAFLVFTLIRRHIRLKREAEIEAERERERREREARAPKWGVPVPIRVYEKLCDDLNDLSEELKTYKDEEAISFSGTVKNLSDTLANYSKIVNKENNPLVPAKELRFLYDSITGIQDDVREKLGAGVASELEGGFARVKRRLREYMDKEEEEEFKPMTHSNSGSVQNRGNNR
jgi:phosphate/sulfate permease